MRLLAPLIILCAMLLVAMQFDDSAGEADLVIANASDVFTLDPQRMSYIKDFRVAYALYEPLATWNTDDFTIRPAAAESWTVSDDRMTYTFQLAPDARWSNGDRVTANDFVYSFRRLLLPDTAADYSNLLFVIDGAEDFFHWRRDQTSVGGDANEMWRAALSRFERGVGVRAIDERTLQIRLQRPTAYFLDLLCFAVCCPVHQPSVEGWPADWSGDEPPPFDQRRWLNMNETTGKIEQQHGWARPEHLVTNGAYVLAEWRYKRDMRLEKNPYFHRRNDVRSDTILFRTIEDANTRILAYETGDIDWLTSVEAEYQADMLAQRRAYEERYADEIAGFRAAGLSLDDAVTRLPEPEEGERRDIRALPSFGTDFFSFNCRPLLADGRDNPFADAAVRRAFVYATDRQAIVDNATRLNEPVMTTLIPPGSIPGYESPRGLGYDVDRARHEFADAGWIDRDNDGLVENENGDAFPVIDLLYRTNNQRYKWMCLALKAQWENALGVRVELRGLDTKFYKEDLKLGQYMIGCGRWYGDYGDPTTFLELCYSTNGNNDRGYDNAKVDRMLDQAAGESDPDKRMRMLEECERFLFQEELPILPICQLVELYMYDPTELRGMSTHPRLVQLLYEMHVAPNEQDARPRASAKR